MVMNPFYFEEPFILGLGGAIDSVGVVCLLVAKMCLWSK
jgi:agmatine/peptidylarginine deiminase